MRSSPIPFVLAVSLLAAAGCKPASKPDEGKTGPVVATVGGDSITADELKSRLDQMPPYRRAQFATPEGKKQLLDGLVDDELLAQEAYKRGLDKKPMVRQLLKQYLAQDLLRSEMEGRLKAITVDDQELQKYYDEHKADYVRPERLRVNRILVAAPAGDAKARKAAQKKAQALLDEVKKRDAKNEISAFDHVAAASSDDAASKANSGDIGGFVSQDDLVKVTSPAFAAAAFALKNPNDKAGPIETPQGFELVKLQARIPAVNQTFDLVKDQLKNRILHERRFSEEAAFRKKLREDAKVKIDETELAKVAADSAPAGQPGMGMAPPRAMPPPGARPPQPPGPVPGVVDAKQLPSAGK